MEIIIQKYGGSSLTDLERILRVAERVEATTRAGHAVVVVVSAMGNTTNELIALARQISGEPDRRELDMLISVGERISMALLAMALRDRGCPARSLTGSQSGIITDETHADARVVEVRPSRVRAHLDAGEVVIVAGFQGVSRSREVTTLGRGGSDTTAVALAAALGARWCELYSDVDGVWSADPRAVPEAVKLDDISLSEALQLARGGARVLFEDAVQFARDRGVSIVAASAMGPGAGTRIEASARAERAAVAGDAGLVRARVVDGAALGGLDAAGLRVRRRAGEVVLLDARNAHGELAVPGLALEGATATVTVVRSGLARRAVVVQGVRDALGELVTGLWGASGDEAWFEVRPDDLDDAVRRAHASVG